MFALRNRRNPRKAIYTKEYRETRRRESPSSRERELRVHPPLFSRLRSFILRVSRSHARVPFTRQTGLRFLRASTSRRMLIFAIYTAWEPNLHHYP